jgi:EAL domain-containing protein (putative c-di-GMP-specific phosphodiesterase class I)
MDFIKVECATCQRPLLAATELQDAAAPPTLECMLCKPARYPFCLGCQLPLYVSNVHDAPALCSECRAPQIDGMTLGPKSRLYLEGLIEDRAIPRRVILESFPFTIGRSFGSSLQINRDGVSRNHAHIDRIGGHVYLTDMQSKNGTYVDRKRITEPIPIQHGDIIHFADYEFRLLEIVEPIAAPPDICETMSGNRPRLLPSHSPTKMKEFTELLERGFVQGCHQMVVDRFGKPIGYELLGRGTHPNLSENPAALFTLARTLDQEIQLSELFRSRSLAEAHAAHLEGLIFINIHPKECQDMERLLRKLQNIRERYPELALVCEIHEAAVIDLKHLAEIRSGLQALGIRLAYDNFGADPGRLLEWVKEPSDVLKFDASLITGLISSVAPTYPWIKTLTEWVKKTGSKTVAEGVESEEIVRMCHQLGIDYIQGFFYSRPTPIITDAAHAASVVWSGE